MRVRGHSGASLPLLLLAVVALLTSITGAGAAAATPSGPALKVTPAEDLATDDQVSVSGSGFRANTPLFVMETIALPASGVPVTHAGRKRITTDRSGKFTTQLTVRQSFTGIDCAATRCFITAITATPRGILDRGQHASTQISFRETREPELAVVPSNGLQRGNEVTVTGTGFVKNSRLSVAQTVARPDQGRPLVHTGRIDATVDAEGRFTATVKVRPTFGDVNCLQTTCYIAAYPVDEVVATRKNDAWVPIEFDPSDNTHLQVEAEKIVQSESARIGISGGQPHDRYTIAVDGPGEFTAQPHVTADAEGNARVLMMSNFDQAVGDYTVHFTNERTGSVTNVGFTVGTNALFDPAQAGGSALATPDETIGQPPGGDGSKVFGGSTWKSWWVIVLSIVTLVGLGLLAWLARDKRA